MNSQPLDTAHVNGVPDGAGFYKILHRGQVLYIGARETLRARLHQWVESVRSYDKSRSRPSRPTGAWTYVKEDHYLDFPPAELEFWYRKTPNGYDAKWLRNDHLQRYHDQHGVYPLLNRRVEKNPV
jgi:hypothetical protein